MTKKTSTTPLLFVGAAVLPRAAGVHLLRPGGGHGVGGQARRHHRQDHAGGHQPFQRSAGDYQVRIVDNPRSTENKANSPIEFENSLHARY